MECRSLWPLAVCLCTSCTCPCLKSNNTTHIHFLIHSRKHRNTHMSGCNTHTNASYIHKPNLIPLLSRQTTNPFVFTLSPLPVYPAFYSRTAGQNIVHSPPPPRNNHHPSRCTVPFRTSTWATWDSDTRSSIFQRVNRVGGIAPVVFQTGLHF